ncbi:DNA topoisomerase [Pimephales promelas]|nr:DNA topoisomerase [Pimephales promelas]
MAAEIRFNPRPPLPPGTRWKEVRHDNKVTWLGSWTENVQGSIKYIILNPSSRIKLMSSSLRRSSRVTERAEPWRFSVTTRGRHPKPLRNPCRICRSRQEKETALCCQEGVYKAAKADAKTLLDEKSKKVVEMKKKAVERSGDREENKQIALGPSKLNYMDPRISVAWCKKWRVSVEKIYNKTQREKFAWAIDMADEDFEF